MIDDVQAAPSRTEGPRRRRFYLPIRTTQYASPASPTHIRAIPRYLSKLIDNEGANRPLNYFTERILPKRKKENPHMRNPHTVHLSWEHDTPPTPHSRSRTTTPTTLGAQIRSTMRPHTLAAHMPPSWRHNPHTSIIRHHPKHNKLIHHYRVVLCPFWSPASASRQTPVQHTGVARTAQAACDARLRPEGGGAVLLLTSGKLKRAGGASK